MKDLKERIETIQLKYRRGVEWLNNDEKKANGEVLSHQQSVDQLYNLFKEENDCMFNVGNKTCKGQINHICSSHLDKLLTNKPKKKPELSNIEEKDE